MRESRPIKPSQDLSFPYMTKLLLYSPALLFKDRMRNCYPSLIFKIAKYGVFLECTIPIRDTVALCNVLYDRQEQVDELLKDATMDFRQVFKSFHGKEIHVERKRRFLIESAYNLLGLLKGKTIHVSSDNPSLRDYFYHLLTTTNAKIGTDCVFDFDKYDAEVTLKEYGENGYVWVIIIIEGKSPLSYRRKGPPIGRIE